MTDELAARRDRDALRDTSTREAIYAAISAAQTAGRPITVDNLAAALGVDVDTVICHVRHLYKAKRIEMSTTPAATARPYTWVWMCWHYETFFSREKPRCVEHDEPCGWYLPQPSDPPPQEDL